MVSRETSIASGLARLGLSVERDVVHRLDRLTETFLDEAIPKGFLGPNEATDIVGRHILDCAAIAVLIGGCDGYVVDVGSGAGLPSLVLACLGYTVIAVESLGRRAGYIEHVGRDLALDVRVIRRRAEDAAHGELRGCADVVVARALAQPPVALELTLPFARIGGRVILPTSDSYATHLGGAGRTVRAADVDAAAGALGGGRPTLRAVQVPTAKPGSDSGATRSGWFIMVDKITDTADRYPRRAGVPRRRPLG